MNSINWQQFGLRKNPYDTLPLIEGGDISIDKAFVGRDVEKNFLTISLFQITGFVWQYVAMLVLEKPAWLISINLFGNIQKKNPYFLFVERLRQIMIF